MSPKARYALIVGLAVVAAVAGYVAATFNHQQSMKPADIPPRDAQHATSALMGMTLPNASAVEQSLRQWQGKVLVVNFWAAWCLPCREEMPGFSRLHAKYAAKGVQFVGIAFDSADNVKEFSNLTPVSYPLLIGSSALMPITAELGDAVGGLPFTVIIGRDGSLVQTRLGLWKEAALEAILADQPR
ncbi:MAG: TlpA disulfide reductase family protein [Proteobacteria bacterium]|nr:TlpA disulfide reductase family protein [Pseudomonadota bacterium]